MRLFKFHNVNASSMRTIMIANCHDTLPSTESDTDTDLHAHRTCGDCQQVSGDTSHSKDTCECSTEYAQHQCTRHSDASPNRRLEDNSTGADNAQAARECHDMEWGMDSDNTCRRTAGDSSSSQSLGECGDSLMGCDCNHPRHKCHDCGDENPESHGAEFMQCSSTSDNNKSNQSTPKESGDKYLIFTTGLKTYTPHQIGVKRIRSLEAERKMNMPRSSVSELPNPPVAPPFHLMPDIAENQGGLNQDEPFDSVDHLIELHGHIIGMCLTPDHRSATKLCSLSFVKLLLTEMQPM